jgi:soluble lytic murein transglycosylase-like protein
LLGGRQRLVLFASFAAGVTFVALGAKVRLSLPNITAAHEMGPVPVEPVEGGEVHTTGALYERVAAVAARYDLDPALVMALIEVESGSDPRALSPKGAQGLMQVMPETAADVGLPEAADPAANLEAGCRYLAALLDSFGGDVRLALAAYNAGPGAVHRWGNIPPYRETRVFVARVSTAYRGLVGTDLLASERIGTDAGDSN